jgi:hypothetical protein
MKKLSTSLLSKLSNSQMDSFVVEVKETIAPGFYYTNCRTFTSAELWNIQRNGKNRPKRRFL